MFLFFSCESEFEGSVSQVKFFKPYEDDLIPPKGLERSQKYQLDPSAINLLAVSTLSPSVVYEVHSSLDMGALNPNLEHQTPFKI